MKSREISLERARELRNYNLPYEEAKRLIPKGMDAACRERYQEQKGKILSLLNASPEDWDDWRWQMKNRIDDAALLGQVLALSPEESETIRQVSSLYRWALTPYYLALIDPEDRSDPIKKLSVPCGLELDERGLKDPMNEEFTNPAGAITRRYPDRLILNLTNACAMFCRHCQRRRRIGEFDRHLDDREIDESIEYIRRNPEIRDVLITGGDPMTLSNRQLETLISRIRAIRHVEIIRIGTRVPVTMPQRIDEGFLSIVKKYQPLFINTQFNHPKEMTPEAAGACSRLADAGVPMGNQMVLLEGVNNDKYVVRLLNHEMLKVRVRPYYIFHAKQVVGTLHFTTSIDDGLEIMEDLRGSTSGMAIPTYILNAPGGLGKIPLLPEYIVRRDADTVTLRTWEGKLVNYPNHGR